MLIIAESRGQPLTEIALEGANIAIAALTEVAQARHIVSCPACNLDPSRDYPVVVKRMIAACQLTKDKSLTPMAAVAGSISDIVADVVVEKGGTKVVVDNCGGIAIRLKGAETAMVGVSPRVGYIGYTHTIRVTANSGIGGLATSGFGGRGFTKGIASAAIAISSTGALADACSTMLGNAVNYEGAPVIKKFAEELDPSTDIAGQRVTFEVMKLSRKNKVKAVNNGLKKANELINIEALVGAVIFVDDEVGMIPANIARPIKRSRP